jgi:hypothetical protein
MRPKEIQEKLGIDAERIKLFKREGIFKPEHPPVGNKTTDYTEADFKPAEDCCPYKIWLNLWRYKKTSSRRN